MYVPFFTDKSQHPLLYRGQKYEKSANILNTFLPEHRVILPKFPKPAMDVCNLSV